MDLDEHHDRIAAILTEWSANLLASPLRLSSIEKVLSPAFAGSSLRAFTSTVLRPGPSLEVRRVSWAGVPARSRDAFLTDLQLYLSDFSRLVTAQFQVTRIDAAAGRLRIRVRYELVGTGKDFYREQRSGTWDLEWQITSPAEYHVQTWRTGDETRARSASPWYVDICRQTLGGNASYSAQLAKGVDYWRTVLDGACGIDIYGHNGVSVGDIDGDGFDDLYVCQPAGLPNRLYRNRRDGTFEDITEMSGVGILENTACALFADLNNQGRQDLVVVRANGPLLFLNEGGGKFRRNPDAFQFATAPQGTFTGAAAADYDRDGWLDIYFCLYLYYQGANQYKYPVPYYAAENGPPNFLMRNNRDGTFRDVTAQSGLNQNNTRYSFCCGWGDYNRDGWPDLYVVNDFGRKNLYRNNGDGTFTDVAAQAGVEDIGAGMSVCWFDYDNDGRGDLYVADMWTAAGERITAQKDFKKETPQPIRALYRKHAMGNSLLRNKDNGTFEDLTAAAHVAMGRWSWSSDALDFDHDGFADLYIANGMLSGPIREDLNSFFWREVVANSPDEAKSSSQYEQAWNKINDLIRADHTWSGFERNVFYANNRDGSFSDISGAVGLDFIEDGRAFALADFDHDGRQEIFLRNRNAPQLRILKNVHNELPPSIAFRLRGTKSNRDAIGAIVTVTIAQGRQTRMLQAGSGFLSQHSKEVFFGLGDARGPVQASIRWPSGLVQELHDLPLDHRISIDENAETFRAEPFRTPTAISSVVQEKEALPVTVETWLLAPIPASGLSPADLNGRTTLLSFGAVSQTSELSVPILVGSKQLSDIYSVLYRYLFDRHRDLTFPTSFLIDKDGNIVKIYQGPIKPETVEQDSRHIPQTVAERLANGLPFRGVADTFEFGRNYLSFGSVFFQRGYYDPSAAFFGLALRDDPTSAEAQYGLGSVYLAQNKTIEARESFERAVKLKASYPNTLPNSWNNLGLIAGRERRPDAAVACFERALRLDPDNVIALENLGSAYRQQKRWNEARKALERALEIDPRSPEANYTLGMVFAETGQTQRAYECLEKALTIRPTYAEAWNNLGVLYLRTQRRDQAVASFEQCIRVAPGFDQAYLNLARVYIIEEQRDKARAVILELLKQHPENTLGQKMLEQVK